MKGHSVDAASRVIEDVLCNVCEQVITNPYDVENHVNPSIHLSIQKQQFK